MAVVLLAAGIDILVQGQIGTGLMILGFAACFVVLALVQRRRGVF